MNQIQLFFVNKFNWLDAAPMTTISTFFTHALAKLGYETTLIARGEPSINTNDILEDKFGLKPIDLFKVKLFPDNERKYIKKASNYYWKAIRFILSDRDKNKQTIVLTRNTTFLPYLVFLKTCCNIRVIFESHGYHGAKTLPGLPKRNLPTVFNLSYQYRIIERLFLNKIDGLVCITNPQRQLYVKDFVKIPMVTLPMAASDFSQNEESLKTSSSYTSHRLCYIGRLTQHINYEMIFEALQLLKNRDIKFSWIGLKANDFPILENLKNKWHLQNRIELIGWMPHQQMRHYLLNNVSVGLVAYKNSFRSAAVTSPSKIFDYFAVGLPVIAPKIPTVLDIISHNKNGLLFEADNAQSLAAQIDAIFENPKQFTQLQYASKQSADEFSWHNRALKLIEFMSVF